MAELPVATFASFPGNYSAAMIGGREGNYAGRRGNKQNSIQEPSTNLDWDRKKFDGNDAEMSSDSFGARRAFSAGRENKMAERWRRFASA